MKSSRATTVAMVLLAATVAVHAQERELQQAPWEVAPQPVIYNPSNKTVNVQGVVNNLVPVENINGTLDFQGANKTVEDPDGGFFYVTQSTNAAYPDPKTENPNGWRFKVKANSSVTIATKQNFKIQNSARADSKLAPAIATAGTNVITRQGGQSATSATAYARPGLQYGATVAKADQFILTTQQDVIPFVIPGNPPISGRRLQEEPAPPAPFELPTSGQLTGRKLQQPFGLGTLAADINLLTRTAARAEAGQGITVAGASAVLAGNLGIASEVRSFANSARWYMSPGHAISGSANIVRAGRIAEYSNIRSRSSLGTATGGVINWGESAGTTTFAPFGRRLRSGPFWFRNNVYSEIDHKVNNDAGNAAAGYLNIQRTLNGKVALRNFPGASAATAVGNAVAGGMSVAFSANGKAQIGDYDTEIDSPENDVAATTRGRGPAEAGQVNMALSPNDDAESLGDIRATANQGSAVAGAFTLTNSYGTSEQGVDVNSRTSDYQAIAGNVGVSQAQQRSVIANSATAKTTTGSALAYNIANAAVSVQNSATSSADATTTTGQAAALSASQGLGGVHSDTQGAGSATTSTGNALSVGTALSGAAFTTRAVSTSAAASKEGQAVSGSWSGAVSGDAQADTASSAATTTGNAASVAQGYGLSALNGKATVASSAGTESGSAGSLGIGISTGIIQAQSKVASSAETKDGRAQSLAGALSAAGINSVASATSSGASETGDVTSEAQAGAIGAFHGEAAATSSSGTGCVDCISDSVANAVATGFISDALARSAADSDKNPGNALANAIAVGAISRTSNGGSARIAVGPGQAISGGFAVAANKKVSDTIAAAIDPKSKKAAIEAQKAAAQL